MIVEYGSVDISHQCQSDHYFPTCTLVRYTPRLCNVWKTQLVSGAWPGNILSNSVLVDTGYILNTWSSYSERLNFQINFYTMRERLKRTSIFSTFRKKLDIFNWKANDTPEGPILLSVNTNILQPSDNDISTLHR